jgi:hypothetical protein
MDSALFLWAHCPADITGDGITDLDGNFDVLAGPNPSRAVNIGAADFDKDGDMDIFRYPSHDSTRFYLIENRIIE